MRGKNAARLADIVSGITGLTPEKLGEMTAAAPAGYPDLSPDDPLAARKVALVMENERVNVFSGTDRPLGSSPGSVTPSQFAALLDEMGPERTNAEGRAYYLSGLHGAPAGADAALMGAAGVPPAVAGAAASYSPTEGVRAYREELAGSSPRGAWLGVGEVASVAAAWLCGAVPGARFVDVGALLMDANGRGRFGPDGSARLFSGLSGASLLVLDGMGAGGWTAATAEMLASVVDARRKAGTPTAYTAEFPMCELAGRVGREAGTEAASRLMTAVNRSTGRSRAERAAHTIMCRAESRSGHYFGPMRPKERR